MSEAPPGTEEAAPGTEPAHAAASAADQAAYAAAYAQYYQAQGYAGYDPYGQYAAAGYGYDPYGEGVMQQLLVDVLAACGTLPLAVMSLILVRGHVASSHPSHLGHVICHVCMRLRMQQHVAQLCCPTIAARG